MIIDVHARIKRNRMTKEFLVSDQLTDMEKNGISKRVLSTFDANTVEESNNAVLSLENSYPDKFIACPVLNPKLDNCLEELNRLKSLTNLRIIEMDSLECGFVADMHADNINHILEFCQVHDVVVKIYTGSTHRAAPQQWARYFDSFPTIKFVIEHMGAGDYQYSTVGLCHEFSNLYLETSIACEMPALNKAFREIDADRILFGSNYSDYFTELEIMKFNHYALSRQDKEKIFYKNAIGLLKL